MKALVLRGDYDIAVEERPDPRPGSSEVVVEVIATGICGSDFHGYSGENGRRHPGQVMGHETVGRIDELGSGVTGLAPGQLVTVNPVMGCNDCAACASGQQQWCSRKVVLGVAPEISAAFAERVAVPAANIVTLPEEMPAELGALVEPLAVGYHAVRRGDADRGGPGAGHRRRADRAGVPARRPAAGDRQPGHLRCESVAAGAVRRARRPGDRSDCG